MDLLAETLPPMATPRRITPSLAAQLSKWANASALSVDATTAAAAVLTWSRLHGFVSLEIAGNFASMGLDPEALFKIELRALP